jgi:peptidoglycan hydrolase CwlO-like protein
MGSPLRRQRSFVHRVVVVAAVLALAGSVPAAGASAPSTTTRLRTAHTRLADLERRIAAEDAAVAVSQGRLLSLAARLHAARSRFDAVEQQLAGTRWTLAQTQGEFEAIRARLDARAVSAYMTGPASGLEIVLESTSPSNLADRMQVLDSLAIADGALSRQIDAAAAQLADMQAEQSDLLETQASAVVSLNRDQAQLAATFAAQQHDLADLSAARSRLSQVAAGLRTRQFASAPGGSGSVSYVSWAGALLGDLGDDICRNDLVVVVAWETAERTAAGWNPLATTYAMPGDSRFNSSGVRNFRSMGQGIRATILTLRTASHGYEAILSDLAGCADPMVTAQAINASAWCRGCAGGAYVVDLIAVVDGYLP